VARRDEALGVALAALARREHSGRSIRERLQRAGFSVEEAEAAVEELVQEGLLSEERFAAERARVLAERGRGDAAIRLELEQEGLRADAIEDALAALEPERDRAERLVVRRGATPGTARLLVRRGFDEEVVATAVAQKA
jgi:regulatory protein